MERYSETLNYLFTSLPMYQRIGAAAYKADLNQTLKLAELCHHPENKFKSIHVAGTNGKGSTSSFLASIFMEAGYKTGLYTSPHLVDFRERIKIDGNMISKEAVVDFVEKYKSYFDTIQPSFFEMTVAMAFDFFAKENVDIAIIEVGMGGRLDSTNIIMPEISVITNISKDHVQFLGHSLSEIAGEKAGIIKYRVPVVIGETQENIKSVFIDKAIENQSEIIFADQTIQLEDYVLNTPLKGLYQVKNLKTVLAVIEKIQSQKKFRITKADIENGIQNVVKNTGLSGRWQIIGEKPLVVCDTGHNEGCFREITTQFRQTAYSRLHIIMTVVNDKDLSAILNLLPKDAVYYFTKSSVPRSLPAEELSRQALMFQLKGNVYEDVGKAYQAAMEQAAETDFVFIGGSTFTVADFLILRK